jgi:hydantoinase/carbamoylase family amidase
MVPINTDRIRADIDAIAACTQSPGGADRPTFSGAWRKARDYVVAQARGCGCNVWIDAAGNVHARSAMLAPETPAWLCGSHIDSVPNGGHFDGVTGVVVALELLRAAGEDAGKSLALELIIFAEEEGTTFGLGMLGSRAWVGALSREQLSSVRNKDGQSYLQAGADCGVDAEKLAGDGSLFRAENYRGLIEVHIEQGPGMWKNNIPVALVTAIAGRRQYRCSLSGVANHAGSTSMTDRQDALVGAATLILQLEGMARGMSPLAVCTVGRIHCRPNAINVIPAAVDFSIDFRAPSDTLLAEGDVRIRALVEQVASRRDLKVALEQTESAPAVEMDLHVCAALERAVEKLAIGTVGSTVSGALHDSAVMAPYIPTAMLFVASRDGVSHNPAEFSRIEDIAMAATIAYEMVQDS